MAPEDLENLCVCGHPRSAHITFHHPELEQPKFQHCMASISDEKYPDSTPWQCGCVEYRKRGTAHA